MIEGSQAPRRDDIAESFKDVPGRYAVLRLQGLDSLLTSLSQQGFRTIGPTLRDEAVIYDDIETTADFPIGWTDEQEGGHYRLKRRDDRALFGYVVGPHAMKCFLHPSRQPLWHAEKTESGYRFEATATTAQPFAFVGVRACDIRAMSIQDRVFEDGAFKDTHYQARRRDAFIVAVNCAQAAATCFCASMGSGPKVERDFDLALTELDPASDHRFLIEVGTERGRRLLGDLPHGEATPADIEAAETTSEKTAASMTRKMPAGEVKDLLMRNLEHPRWDEVAERCLSCGNCTMVCPTCFCTQVDEDTQLTDEVVSRSRQWTSCFSLDFSYIHGGSVRHSASSRYRQWITHKLATWHDQFDESGCVGCGRCITWCPVGIDITEEVRAIQDSET
ncbi:MAG: 4Fe-4S dicluster domain-containing protein, partial [Geminicoccaceae bacterium]